MFNKVAALTVTSVWGLSSHHQAFLAAAPEEEVMGPNLNFSPVSTTMQCTINLTLQYMLVFAALGICRTYLDFTNVKYSDSVVSKALKHASETVFYAPMVCLMFVGFRMRVLQLSKGTGNPQEWVQFAMQSVAYSILANTILVLIVPVFAGEVTVNQRGELDEKQKPFKNETLATVFSVIRYVTFLGLYVGFGAVCVGVFLYEPAAGTWEGEIPALSPAVACTMTLSTAFFLVYFLHAASRTVSQFTKAGDYASFEETMERGMDTLAMAPMLCVLFLGARMRALQMDPVGGNPQSWAQNCFYTCTYAIIFQTILSISAKYVLGVKEIKKNDKVEGDMSYVMPEGSEASWTMKALTFCRWFIMISVYAGAVAVVCSVFTIEHPDGAEHTPAISPTMQCVINLAFQYFLIYLLLWIFFTVHDLGFENVHMDKARDAIESAKSTVQFAPMLCVLFIATRMRALQITDNKGAPQGWVQDGMYLASWSVLIQFMMCLILPFFTGGKIYTPDRLDREESADGEKKEAILEENSWGAYVVTFIRYVALISLLGGVATVITGVFMMTPETANGRGAIPLITDGTLPVDLAPPPPGVNDIPGANEAMKATGETVGAGVDVVNTGTDTVTSPVTDVAAAGADTVTSGVTEAVAQ